MGKESDGEKVMFMMFDWMEAQNHWDWRSGNR
jgi:hypothetical protein